MFRKTEESLLWKKIKRRSCMSLTRLQSANHERKWTLSEVLALEIYANPLILELAKDYGVCRRGPRKGSDATKPGRDRALVNLNNSYEGRDGSNISNLVGDYISQHGCLDRWCSSWLQDCACSGAVGNNPHEALASWKKADSERVGLVCFHCFIQVFQLNQLQDPLAWKLNWLFLLIRNPLNHFFHQRG